MKLFASISRRSINFIAFLATTALVIWLVLRVVLWVYTGPTQMSFTQSLAAFGVGAWFDAWTLAYLIVPFILLSIAMPSRWRASRFSHFLRWATVWLVLYILLFGAVSEFIFWQEFTTRFNFIAVDYLVYTNEVIGNIRESYPVPLILSALAVLVTTIVWLYRRKYKFSDGPYNTKQRIALLAAAFLLPVLSFSLANVDQMDATGNAYANEVAGNGIFSFAAAARRNELDYDKFYKTIPQEQADATLAALGMPRKPLSKTSAAVVAEEKTAADVMGPFLRKPKNVVLITVESLSAEYMGAYGNKKGLTPKMDKLAAEGLKFERLYATGTRTVRGLDSTTIGIPPVPGQAIVHRPDNAHLSTIGELLRDQGYSTFFIYGGYGVFDSMNAYYRANNYQVIDRTDFDPKTIAAENIWGVADESLFDNTLTTLDNAAKDNKPFFAQIMTTSNHRPFTFPEGRIDRPQGKRYAAVKYTDYAIGRFIEQAKAKPWFADTLFVVIGDHCASVAGKTKLPVDKYHIGAFMYNPELIKPAVYKRMVSQIDIVPTLLDVMGAKGSQKFFGESVFAAEKKPARAFIGSYQLLGYYKNNTLIVLSPKRKTEAFKIDPVTFDAEPGAMDATLLQEAIAYYQTASSAFKQGALKKDAD